MQINLMQISSLLENKPNITNIIWLVFPNKSYLHKPNLHYLHETTPYISQKIET